MRRAGGRRIRRRRPVGLVAERLGDQPIDLGRRHRLDRVGSVGADRRSRRVAIGRRDRRVDVDRRQHRVHLADVVGAGRLVLGHQLLVGLLAGAGRHRLGGDRGRVEAGQRGGVGDGRRDQVAQARDGHLEHEDLAATGDLRRPDRQVDRPVRGHHEAGHRRVGDGHRTAGRDLPGEQLQRRAARAQDVPEPDAGERRAVRTAVVGRGAHQLLGEQLGCAHHRRRVGRLVGRGQDHRPDIGRQAGVDHVLRPDDVRLGGLERVVFPRFDVLERRAVEDEVDVLHGTLESVAVADVADQKAEVAPARDAAGADRTASSRRARRRGPRPSRAPAAARPVASRWFPIPR